MHAYRQTNRQADRQIDRQTDVIILGNKGRNYADLVIVARKRLLKHKYNL